MREGQLLGHGYVWMGLTLKTSVAGVCATPWEATATKERQKCLRLTQRGGDVYSVFESSATKE